MAVRTAELEHQPAASEPLFTPAGEYRSRAVDHDYVEEEWFASGEDAAGRRYTTQVFVRRPRDPAKFSGVVVVEPLHIHRIAPIYMYSSPYMLRSGHAWACVAAQKTALDTHVKPTAPERYARLNIESEGAAPGAAIDPTAPPFVGVDCATRAAWWGEFNRLNQATSTILAQVGAALRASSGPFGGFSVDHLILAGHSQTGFVTTNYMRSAHPSQRLADGSPVFDGFFPSGWPKGPLGPCDVPVVQTMCDGDISDPDFSFEPGYEGRTYRRDDGDAPDDRFRLYELAGMPHSGTRYPPFSDPGFWRQVPNAAAHTLPAAPIMNSLPHHELFDVTLHHLVEWVSKGVTPPRGERIDIGPDGHPVRDVHGNTMGGVRCAQLDVPRAAYQANPLTDGKPSFGTVGTEVPFDKAEMQRLYGDPASYVARFERRLEELIREGWLLADDAGEMRREAAAQHFQSHRSFPF